MRNEGRTLLTLEKRLELAARPQATSPEAAARLVKRLSEIRANLIFFGRADMDAMYELTGEFWEYPDVDRGSYQSFSHSFKHAMRRDNAFFRQASPEPSLAKDRNPYQPAWGARISNAMVLLGLMLLDHAKGRLRPKDFYYCMRMTLGQYLDAMTDLSFGKDGSLDTDRVKRFQNWKDMLLKDYDGTMPLEEALAELIRRYITAWQEFDHLDHVLYCMGGLSCYLEQEEAGRTLSQEEEDNIRRFRTALCRYGSDLEGWDLVEVAKRYMDPYGYYFILAYEYPEDVPDPGSKDTAPGTLRRQLFLPERDYSPESLRELAARSPFPDLRALLEKYIRGERLASAMREIDVAVMDLYMLWVEPYLQMEEYHYERHLE